MPRYSWTRSWQWQARSSVVLATVSSTLCGEPTGSSTEKKAHEDVIHPHHLLSHTGVAPIPPIRVFRPNPYLEIAYDVRTRNPVYVLEQLQPELWVNQRGRGSSSEGSTSSTNRRPHFYEEKKLPEQYRSRNSHYRNTEYDRGHMAPAADFNFPQHHDDSDNDHHKHKRQQLIDTFNLCNTAPQLPGVNRKVWAALEDWTRRVASAAHEQAARTTSGTSQTDISGPTTTTLVLTGPLFLPARKVVSKSDKDKQVYQYQYEYAAIGQAPALQSVPTHFFKVVMVVLETSTSRSIQAFSCFVVPNHESAADETNLTRFVVPWTALEIVLGLKLFAALTTTSFILGGPSHMLYIV
jgi:endonuclease G